MLLASDDVTLAWDADFDAVAGFAGIEGWNSVTDVDVEFAGFERSQFAQRSFGPVSIDAGLAEIYIFNAVEMEAINTDGIEFILGKYAARNYEFTVMRADQDADIDRISNAWEMQYFGGATNCLASADADGDGFSNLEEFFAATNPTNATSQFAISASTAEGFAVNWSPVDGREYSVYWSSNLTANFELLASGLTAPQSSYVDTAHDMAAGGFYRVGVYTPSANFAVDAASSHTAQSEGLFLNLNDLRMDQPANYPVGTSYIDFDGDGDTDVLVAVDDDTTDSTKPVEVYLNDGEGNFALDAGAFGGNPPVMMHPNCVLTADFNGDGKLDVFIVGAGVGEPTYAGEAPCLILSGPGGYAVASGLETFLFFSMGASAADIDADGDIDIFVAGMNPIFLINDGVGNFTQDPSRLEGLDGFFIAAELVDVDADGYADLLAGGQEYEGFASRIFWGDSTGLYSTQKQTLLPGVGGYGIVGDIDVADLDEDGKKEIVLKRTGDGTGAAVADNGYYIQIVGHDGGRGFADQTVARFLDGSYQSVDGYCNSIVLRDLNDDGAIDIVDGDVSNRLSRLNDGDGRFSD
jgi:hypothetical protein